MFAPAFIYSGWVLLCADVCGVRELGGKAHIGMLRRHCGESLIGNDESLIHILHCFRQVGEMVVVWGEKSTTFYSFRNEFLVQDEIVVIC